MTAAQFRKTIWSYYNENGRSMPWRDKPTPYYVVVSEIMLQQTQVTRVVGKFELWIEKFPNWKALARASVREVLAEWSGLGYNRRALYLKRIAEVITENGKLAGTLPQTQEELISLPGIGSNTAGSILAFAFNQPTIFIETNIRSVYIHFFFPEIEKREGRKACKKISDDQLLSIIKKTVDQKNPREWYWALMDYGSYLKSTLPNPSRRSAHHIKQKPFKGSNREMRSQILQAIMKSPSTYETLVERLESNKDGPKNAGAILRNINDLKKEGFIVERGKILQVK
ncbi:MAG: A/G-specific adenine glycosylase [Patescibacteria group bacterium]